MINTCRLLIYITFLSSLMSYAQTKVAIYGQVNGAQFTRVSLVSYQGYIIDSTIISGGKFRLNEELPGGDRYTLFFRDVTGKQVDSASVYLDNGLVKVTVNNQGQRINFQGSNFANFLNSYYQESASIQKNQSAIIVLNNWVKGHTNSAISLFAIDAYLLRTGRDADWYKVAKLYHLITHQAKENILALRLELEIEQNNTLELGKPFPVFSLPDLKGMKTTNTILKGSYVLIDFWASWCGPCREENKNFLRLSKKYEGKNLRLISISLDKSNLAWKTAITSDQLSWIQLSDANFPNNQLEKSLNLKLIPVDFILDPKGKIIDKNIYGLMLEKKLDILVHLN